MKSNAVILPIYSQSQGSNTPQSIHVRMQHTIQNNTIRYNKIQLKTIQNSTIQYNKLQHNTI